MSHDAAMCSAKASRPLLLLLVAGALNLAACSSAPSGDLDVVDEGASADALSRARFTKLRSGPTDSDLKALHRAGTAFYAPYLGVYRLNRAGREANDPKAREKRIWELLERSPCRFLAEASDIGRNVGPRPVQAVMDQLAIEQNAAPDDAKATRFREALEGVYANPNLDLLSGAVTGDGTSGEVIGVYDVAHHEVLNFGFTTCNE